MAAYSLDLRKKILSAWENKENTQRGIAKRFKVSLLSGAENSGESQDETMVIRANSIRKSNFSRLAIEAQAGGGLVLGKICKRGRGFCW
jgi:transposase